MTQDQQRGSGGQGQPEADRVVPGFRAAFARETMPTLTQLLRMMAVHGAARVLMATGATVALYTLITFKAQDWTWPLAAAAILLTGGLASAGVALRIFEIKGDLFGGRIIALKCGAPGCKRLVQRLEGDLQVGRKPPLPVTVVCPVGHVNLVQ